MSHFAATISKTEDGWFASEMELAEIEDLDGLTDALRDVAADTEASTAVLFVEEDEADDEHDDDEDEEESLRAEADPAGDVELLTDLGTPGKVLLDLCAEEGMLPADIITAVCESLGCAEQVEALR